MNPTVLHGVSKPGSPSTDLETMRKRARQHVEEDVVASGYAADRETVIELLHEALATEIACVLRYKRHYFKAAAINTGPSQPRVRKDSNEQLAHSDRGTARINQLRGKSDVSPKGVAARSHAEYVEVVTRSAMERLMEMIKEELLAERVAVDSYRENIDYRVEQDPTTRLLDALREGDDEHTGALSSRLGDLKQRCF